MATPLRIGILGAGGIARGGHLPVLAALPDLKVTALCDVREEPLKELAQTYAIPFTTTRVEELIGRVDVDAVLVTTPNFYHVPHSVQALAAGKHVLCEKPMAVDARAAEQVVEAAAGSSRVWMLGVNNRYKAESRYLKDRIQAGDLGRPYHARMGWIRRRGSPGGWFAQKKMSGGGPLIDLGVHLLDLGLWLMGSPKVLRVSGQVSYNLTADLDPELSGYRSGFKPEGAYDVEDMACALLHLEGGGSVQLEVTWALNGREAGNWLEIYGDRAGATLWPSLEIFRHRGRAEETCQVRLPNEPGFKGEWVHFMECIRNGSAPETGAEYGRYLSGILDAIYQSAHEGREVVLSAPAK